MKKALLLLLFALLAALGLPLQAQTAFDYNLNRVHANRVVLLGDWSSAGVGKWKQVVDADNIFEYGFTLQNRESFLKTDLGIARWRLESSDLESFERWIRALYGLSGEVRWVALGLDSSLIAFGVQTPSPGEFERLLEQRGVQTPLRMVRSFLRENPDHLDAKADLLKEVRRRALMRVPANLSEDLDTEKDLKTWGVLAAETDSVFKGSWLGVDLDFFRPEEQEQPERYSKLMKAIFSRHIISVESALRQQPTDVILWNTWAWMARGLPDYKWANFINSIEPIIFHDDADSPTSCPSGEVCVWLVADAGAKKDWDTVIKLAKTARGFAIRSNREIMSGWAPGDLNIRFYDSRVSDYPGKSAYAPHLEALLSLGKIDGANDVFDEMIRLEGKIVSNRSNNAIIVANVAKSLGMDDLAHIWERGEQINRVPYITPSIYKGSPQFYVFADSNSDYFKEFSQLNRKLSPDLHTGFPSPLKDIDTLGWRKDDGNRWGLIGADGRLLAHDASIPGVDDMQRILSRFNVKSKLESIREYIARHSGVPGLELFLAFENIRSIRNILINNQNTSLNSDALEALWSETTRYLSGLLTDHLDVLVNMPQTYTTGVLFQHPSMKSLSGPYLRAVESLLERKPSSDALWTQWFLWRGIEGAERSMEPLMERIKPSPLAKPGTIPPAFVIDIYYAECKKNSNWPKVIELLKNVWDREFFKIGKSPGYNSDKSLNPRLGNNVGIPLIEAYIYDNKPAEANTIFNDWLDCGGKFADFSSVIDLAKTLNQERLAREWETRLKRP